ncbi:MAG: RidA family protein [Chloroflexota bacterium]
MKEVVRTDKAPAAVGPYSAGIKAGDYVFVSGQGPLDPQTKKMPEGIEAQTKQTLENVKAIVQAAGASMADVVKVTVLLTDMGNFKAMNEAYKEYFPEPFPARATYGASLALPGMLIEIEAIAYVGK